MIRNTESNSFICHKLNQKMSQHWRGCHHHHTLRPAVTLTFDHRNLTRSSLGASEYSRSVLPNCSSHSWRIVVTISDRTNKQDSLKHHAITDTVWWYRHKNHKRNYASGHHLVVDFAFTHDKFSYHILNNNNNNDDVCLFDWRHNAQSTVTSAMQGGTTLYTEGLSLAKLLPHTAYSDW